MSYYEVQEFYAKVGGERRWHTEYASNEQPTATGSWLIVKEDAGEAILLPADKKYRVLEVEDPA
jgi:hypothetical protein